jgi:hypothetical protein
LILRASAFSAIFANGFQNNCGYSAEEQSNLTAANPHKISTCFLFPKLRRRLYHKNRRLSTADVFSEKGLTRAESYGMM